MTSFIPLFETLTSTVFSVGPEAVMRRTDIPPRARIGANEDVFGTSPDAIAAMKPSSQIGNWPAQAWENR